MADAAPSDKFAQAKGFRLDIEGGPEPERDTAWRRVSGGAMIIEHVERTAGSDRPQTHPPVHGAIEDVTLSGPMTDKRAWLSRWINESQGKGPRPRRTVSITPILQFPNEQVLRPGPTVVYGDCEIVSYVFPCLDAAITTGEVKEEVRIKPLRVEVK